jgi:WD40 repeat protein
LPTGPQGPISAVAVTPDASRLIAGTNAGRLIVWSLSRSETLFALPGHERRVRTLAVTPDGRYAISGADDATLKIWDLEAGRETAAPRLHADAVCAVAVLSRSPLSDEDSGRDARPAPGAAAPQVVSASADGMMKRWDFATALSPPRLSDPGHAEAVSALAVSPDGRHVLSGSADGTLKLWDVVRGAPVRTFDGRTGPVHAVALTPDGQGAVSASKDGFAMVW